MGSAVLDASALLALLNGEEGSEQVAEIVAAGATVSAVNLSEVVAKLAQVGVPEAQIRDALDPLDLQVIDFDVELAYRVAALHRLGRAVGLSLGDRACLAVAQQLALPAVTADRLWARLGLDIEVRVIR